MAGKLPNTFLFCTNRNACKKCRFYFQEDRDSHEARKKPKSWVDGPYNLEFSPSLIFCISDSPFLARFCLFCSQMGGPPLRGNCIINIPKATPTAYFPLSVTHHFLPSGDATTSGRSEHEFPGLFLNEAAIQPSMGEGGGLIKPHR